jgi:hypothetical protein
VEVASLFMCMMEPMNSAIVNALKQPTARQPNGSWMSRPRHDVNALVWLHKLTDLCLPPGGSGGSASLIELNSSQALMLSDWVLEPCIRVMGTLLWRCYGDQFESILVKIRKQVSSSSSSSSFFYPSFFFLSFLLIVKKYWFSDHICHKSLLLS